MAGNPTTPYGRLLKGLLVRDPANPKKSSPLPQGGNMGVRHGPVKSYCRVCGAESTLRRIRTGYGGFHLECEAGCDHLEDAVDRFNATDPDDEDAVVDSILVELGLDEPALSEPTGNGRSPALVIHEKTARTLKRRKSDKLQWTFTPHEKPEDVGHNEWLLEPLLYQASEHLVSGPSGIGKSLFWLRVSCVLGARAAWLDKENGARRSLSRAQSFGLPYTTYPHFLDLQDRQFTYELFDAHLLPLLIETQVEVVFFDPARLFYIDAGVQDTMATGGVDKFKSRVLKKLNDAGISTAMLENTGLQDSGRARGDSSKQSNTMLEWSLSSPSEITPDRAGLIDLVCKKDRDGMVGRNTKLRYRIGGTPFVFAPEGSGRTPARRRAENPERDSRILTDVKQTLATEGPLSTNRLLQKVTGNTNDKKPVLELAAENGELVKEKRGNAVIWSVPGAP